MNQAFIKTHVHFKNTTLFGTGVPYRIAHEDDPSDHFAWSAR